MDSSTWKSVEVTPIDIADKEQVAPGVSTLFYWAATLNIITTRNKSSYLNICYIFNHQGSHEQRKPGINKEFYRCDFLKKLSKLINSLFFINILQRILCSWWNIIDYSETCLQASQHDNISQSVERNRLIRWKKCHNGFQWDIFKCQDVFVLLVFKCFELFC